MMGAVIPVFDPKVLTRSFIMHQATLGTDQILSDHDGIIGPPKAAVKAFKVVPGRR